MEQRNGYFQLIVQDTTTLVRVFAPSEGGKLVKAYEIINYLDSMHVTGFSAQKINDALKITQDLIEIDLETVLSYSIAESMSMTVSADKMFAWCRFMPPSSNGNSLSESDIRAVLTQNKVIFGIDEEKIAEILAGHIYMTDYLIAKGTPPVRGKNANIKYLFETSFDLRPKHNEDGSVNYHELNTIHKVEKGELIAQLEKEVPGVAGSTVTGEVKKTADIKRLRLSHAANTILSEDETQLFSDVTGHVSLVDGKVFVSGVYEVPADVDHSTGNIDYPGNIHIKGNVKSGFNVKADGDIIVEGVVEGAFLTAGGQIIVKRGIHGMSKGVLKAEGNIIIKFIEAAVVQSGGYIETESIIQSQVDAGTDIRVTARKGCIVGGSIRCGHCITAKFIGSELGSATRINVGANPEVMKLFVQISSERKEIAKGIESIKPIVTTYLQKMNSGIRLDAAQLNYMKKLIAELKYLQEKEEEKKTVFEELAVRIRQGGHAKVIVENTIYSGVDILIAEQRYHVIEPRNYCQFLLSEGSIVIRNL